MQNPSVRCIRDECEVRWARGGAEPVLDRGRFEAFPEVSLYVAKSLLVCEVVADAVQRVPLLAPDMGQGWRVSGFDKSGCCRWVWAGVIVHHGGHVNKYTYIRRNQVCVVHSAHV